MEADITLMELLEGLHDLRTARGKRHPLPALLSLAAAVSRWICGRLKPGDTPHLAIDGKTLRGSRDGETPAVHLLSAYAPNVEAIVAQMRAAYG